MRLLWALTKHLKFKINETFDKIQFLCLELELRFNGAAADCRARTRSVGSRRQQRRRRTGPTDRGSLSRRRQRLTERRRLRPRRHNKRRIGEHDEIKKLD